MFQSRRSKANQERNLKRVDLGFVLIFIVGCTVSAVHVINKELDAPHAAVCNNAKTISYFEVPSEDGKGLVKVYPHSKKFDQIMMSGKFESHYVPCAETLNQVNGGVK
jgi:hypothetical protein